jgi:4-hydroxybenzoate polyprenyltransferase
MKLLYKLHLLSLDVVAGAMVCNIMFWKLPDGFGKINLPSITILGVTTWLIYLLDRLLDIRKNDKNLSLRHQFHLQNQQKIWGVVIVLFLVSIVLIFFLPKQIFIFGVITLILVVLYLITINYFSQNIDYQHFKELIVAIIYAMAIVGSAYSVRKVIDNKSLILAINFLIISLQNLVLFSFFESYENTDSKNIIKKIGKQNSQVLMTAFFVTIVASSFVFRDAFNYEAKAVIVEVLMSATLFFMNYFPMYFLKNESYRWFGDGVFLLPMILIFFS